jgi:hypothetical protein
VYETAKVLDAPVPQELDGVTVKVPPVLAFNETLFPEPVIVPVPEYDHVYVTPATLVTL